MSVGEILRDLGRFLDECEERDGVRGVELSHGDGPEEERPLVAEIDVAFPLDGTGGLSIHAADVDSEGGIQFTFASPSGIVPAAEHDVEVDVTDASIGTDGVVTATLAASAPVDDGSGTTTRMVTSAANGSDGQPGSGRGSDVPPFRDAELLAEVYGSCDTFAEMTDEIGMDVTAETVRRYMIDHGIHEPNSYATSDTDGADDAGSDGGGATAPEAADRDTGGSETDDPTTDGTGTGDPNTPAGADAEQVVLADGIGLPDDVTAETLIETVQRSNTILEVKQDIGIERQDALEMLQELNLIDLVIGRLTTETGRDISREEVIERLREASATA